MSSCGYPELSSEQRSVVDGTLLAGGTVAGNGSNRHVEIGTGHEALSEWLADQLGWLCQSVRSVDDDRENRDVVYRVRTAAHPGLNRYERAWSHLGGSSGRAPPDGYRLDATAARVWWAFAGGLVWPGAYDSSRQAVFSADDPDKQAWIAAVLERVGFDTTQPETRVRLSPSETNRWLDWIGDAVPGVEHKWADSQAPYRALRRRPRSEVGYRIQVARESIDILAEQTDHQITADLFDDRVDVIDASAVADLLGGGSFEDALRVELPPDRHPSESDDELGGLSPHDLQPIRRAAASEGEPLTMAKYERWRDGHDDCLSAIYLQERVGGWRPACDLVGIEAGSRGNRQGTISDIGVVDAVRQAAASEGEPLTTEAYEQWRERQDSEEPSLSTVYNKVGFDEACERAGVETQEREEYDDADLLEALRAAGEAIDGSVTIQAYQSFRKGHSNDLPSSGTIASRIGWNKACDLAGVDHG